MSIARTVLLGVLATSVACEGGGDEAASNRHLEWECVKVGNSAEHQYCQVNFTKLLASPERFDGQNIMLEGWVMLADEGIAIFPSVDSINSGELNSSIALLSGSKMRNIVEALRSSPDYNPRLLTIGGEFHMRRGRGSVEGRDHEIRYRFGELQNVEEVRP